MLASRKMMYHQNVSCNEPGHRAGRVRKARSTLIVINSNTMERFTIHSERIRTTAK
ncbi:ALI_collapsed_G0044120.mRNA.1.CDS.1 [Saccharomyces cerevisiae]|nr:ALI_collapsed_G0044120.mRNA.1.CDS.1 [Saccharomyces cerevisiae]